MIKFTRLLNRNLTKIGSKSYGLFNICLSKIQQITPISYYLNTKCLFSTQAPSSSQIDSEKSIKTIKTGKTGKTGKDGKQKDNNKKRVHKHTADDQAYSPVQYYRNIIRRINLKENGKGKFNPVKFETLINLCKTQEHSLIMFEAYYNIIGHFTIIPNRIVDELILKALLVNADINSVIQIYRNHAYLGYFPHYKATNKVLKAILKKHDQATLKKFLVALTCSPLIKINDQIIHTLGLLSIKQETTQIVKNNIAKFLIYRRKQVKQFLSDSQMNSKIAGLLLKSNSAPLQAKSQLKEHIQAMLVQSNQSAEQLINKSIIASAFNFVQKAAEVLAASGEQIGANHQKYFDFIKNLYIKSDRSSNFGQILQNAFRESKVSIQNLKKIEQIKLIVGEQVVEQVQVEAQVEQEAK